jgi:hypothetical protein
MVLVSAGQLFNLAGLGLPVAAGTTFQSGSFYISDAAGLAVTATALIFTVALIASRALRSVPPSAPRHRTYGPDL